MTASYRLANAPCSWGTGHSAYVGVDPIGPIRRYGARVGAEA